MIFHWWHVLVVMFPMIPTLWSILHIRGHEFETPQQRALWLVLVVFLPCVGGIIYIFTGRKKVLGKVQN